MNPKTFKFPKNNLWLILMLMMLSMACNLSDLTKPTSVVYPTAAIVPTASPTPQLPTIELVDANTISIVGEEENVVVVGYADAGLSYFELAIDNEDRHSTVREGQPGTALETTTLETSLVWTPDESGEYTLTLTAYDVNNLASEAAKINVNVYAKPEILIYDGIFLSPGDSYDFMAEKIGELTGGDLYISRNNDGTYSAWADNPPQVGGIRLYAPGELDIAEYFNVDELITKPVVIKKVLSPEVQSGISTTGVDLEEQGLYLFKRSQAPGEYILFEVDSIDPLGVFLFCTVFNLP